MQSELLWMTIKQSKARRQKSNLLFFVFIPNSTLDFMVWQYVLYYEFILKRYIFVWVWVKVGHTANVKSPLINYNTMWYWKLKFFFKTMLWFTSPERGKGVLGTTFKNISWPWEVCVVQQKVFSTMEVVPYFVVYLQYCVGIPSVLQGISSVLCRIFSIVEGSQKHCGYIISIMLMVVSLHSPSTVLNILISTDENPPQYWTCFVPFLFRPIRCPNQIEPIFQSPVVSRFLFQIPFSSFHVLNSIRLECTSFDTRLLLPTP